jgi:3-oxoacyl-[acyl-carrier-protein] synthase-3
MTTIVDKALKQGDLTISDIDFFVTHQPVYWATNAWREGLGIPEEHCYETFQKYGNIANCAAAVNLFEAAAKKLIKKGDIVLIASSGAGENYIALLERIGSKFIDSLYALKA